MDDGVNLQSNDHRMQIIWMALQWGETWGLEKGRIEALGGNT